MLPGPLWPGVVAPDRVLSMIQVELFDHLNCVQTNDLCLIELLEIELFDHLAVCKTNDWCLIKLLVIHSNTWNHLTVCKRMSHPGSFKNIIDKMCLQIIHLICMFKEDLALNNIPGLICYQLLVGWLGFMANHPL